MNRTLVVVIKRVAIAVAALLMLAIALPGGWWIWKSQQWSNWRVAESERRGNVIVAALESYREAHGVYPESLDALRPQYLAETQSPVAGNRRWEYGTMESGQDFELSFGDDSDWFPSDSIQGHGDSWWLDTH